MAVMATPRTALAGAGKSGAKGLRRSRPKAAAMRPPAERSAVIAVVAAPPAALVAVGMIGIRAVALVAAGVGIAWSLVLAIGVWIELRAIAGIVDHLLRHGRAS